jgi:hypothetical protein
LQLRVLRLGLLEDGDVGLGVFAQASAYGSPTPLTNSAIRLSAIKKLRVTLELAFEIIQQRKQAYWEFGALFVAAWGAEENSSANRLF